MFSKTVRISTLVAVAALAFYGCGDDTSGPVCDDNSEALRSYLIANDLDLPDLLVDWLIDADAVHDNESAYHIMDIRSESAYDQGHIPGAVLSSLTGILADAAGNNGKPIVVACYTGQIAGHAVMALRLSGYPDAKVLRFGMSAWNEMFDYWSGNCADIGITHPNWIAPPGNTAATEEHSYPPVSACVSDGASILAQQVAAMLEGGFRGINGINVLDTPNGYFINNYWLADTVSTYGNIAGARRIRPMTLENGEIRNCDPGATIVTYCWTGHTSSMITAYLTVLGYDAVSLKFGVNSMIHSDLTSNRWIASYDYDYDTTVP